MIENSSPVTAVFCLTCSYCGTSTQTDIVPVETTVNMERVCFIRHLGGLAKAWHIGRIWNSTLEKFDFKVFCPRCWEKIKQDFIDVS